MFIICINHVYSSFAGTACLWKKTTVINHLFTCSLVHLTSESDVYRRQILTSKIDPLTERVTLSFPCTLDVRGDETKVNVAKNVVFCFTFTFSFSFFYPSFYSAILTSVTMIFCRIPASTRHWTTVGLMLSRRRRQWANINPALVQCLVFAGMHPRTAQHFYFCCFFIFVPSL